MSALDGRDERDDFVSRGFGVTGLERPAQIAGSLGTGAFVPVEVGGHPRVIGRLNMQGRR